MDRHPDWAVIICLVGEGQEIINTGEAGIGEWIQAAAESFPDWKMYISPRIEETEFSRGMHGKLKNLENVFFSEDLHLSVSMRTFRTENYSILIKNLLDLKSDEAIKSFDLIRNKFPIAITRDLAKAKQWLREKARGSERYGIVVSSVAQRLKPYAIDVKSPVDPVHWFLDGKDDIRSSYYLEDVVTEYKVQGLEIDWVCLTWDADFRFNGVDWENYAFVGDKWNHIRKMERKLYQKNSYRVLLTRARMGMIIFVPYGDSSDPTRKASFYDSTYAYLKKIGFSELIE